MGAHDDLGGYGCETSCTQHCTDSGGTRARREQGDAGDYADACISSTSTSMSGYQRLKMAPNSPSSVFTRICSNKCAPDLDHCICCFLQNRLLTTSLTVDSTKPVAIASLL